MPTLPLSSVRGKSRGGNPHCFDRNFSPNLELFNYARPERNAAASHGVVIAFRKYQSFNLDGSILRIRAQIEIRNYIIT